ncbi:MAG: Prepilin-type N-terminal cleavage/methylation protein [Deltaproteobacteria bacterium]|nr:Prepilin-type N-terminal cleavage/methylation protein [Deltaproteobacteria bacterium]
MTLHRYVDGRQAGFTFNELLVAMSIVAVAVLGYSLSSIDVLRRQTIGDNSTVAIHLAQDKIEELQARKNLADGDLCPSGGDRGISATGKNPRIFDRCWRVATSALGDDVKQIEVTVSWRDHSAHQVTLSTLSYRGE